MRWPMPATRSRFWTSPIPTSWATSARSCCTRMALWRGRTIRAPMAARRGFSHSVPSYRNLLRVDRVLGDSDHFVFRVSVRRMEHVDLGAIDQHVLAVLTANLGLPLALVVDELADDVLFVFHRSYPLWLHRRHAQPRHQFAVTVAAGIGRGEQLRPIKNRIGPGEETQRLRLLAHVLAAGGEAHHRARHTDAGGGDGADKFEWLERRLAGERRAGDAHQHVDRHRFRMRRQARQGRDHADAILARFAHADDAAAADVNAGIAHVVERLQAVLIGARGDDLLVELRRGVEVVIVEIEAGVFEPPRLAGGEHAERGAGLEPERLDALDHGADRIEIAILRLAPRRAHAEAAGAAGLRGARFV